MKGKSFWILFSNQDADDYRQSFRSNLSEWFATLNSNGINDWLIVFDSSKERENKNNRPSVMERLRIDFSKYSTRLVYNLQYYLFFLSIVDKMPALTGRLREQLVFAIDSLVNSAEKALKSSEEQSTLSNWNMIEHVNAQVCTN